MKIEKRKYKTLHIGDVVKVHSYEYIKDIINYAKLKGCDISPYNEFMYGKQYQVDSIKEMTIIENFENFEKAFPSSQFIYLLKSDHNRYYFYEFEIINCR